MTAPRVTAAGKTADPSKFTGPVQHKLLDGGVYVWRVNKPWTIWGLPLIGRHFGYVGETIDFVIREREHLQGGGRYRSRVKSWSDLKPKCYRIPLPCQKPLLRAVETLLIWVLCPTYNVAKQPVWNFRRIPQWQAKMQRNARAMESPFWIAVTAVGLRHFPMLAIFVGYLAWMYWS